MKANKICDGRSIWQPQCNAPCMHCLQAPKPPNLLYTLHLEWFATPAGADCIAHMMRAETDGDANAVVETCRDAAMNHGIGKHRQSQTQRKRMLFPSEPTHIHKQRKVSLCELACPVHSLSLCNACVCACGPRAHSHTLSRSFSISLSLPNYFLFLPLSTISLSLSGCIVVCVCVSVCVCGGGG